ncbi:MAG TPA: hypothetical protein DCE42_27055, partial [Myxococcales bacterium]|nr:hypothetical protein [Myxococcales bacterium]
MRFHQSIFTRVLCMFVLLSVLSATSPVFAGERVDSLPLLRMSLKKTALERCTLQPWLCKLDSLKGKHLEFTEKTEQLLAFFEHAGFLKKVGGFAGKFLLKNQIKKALSSPLVKKLLKNKKVSKLLRWLPMAGNAVGLVLDGLEIYQEYQKDIYHEKARLLIVDFLGKQKKQLAGLTSHSKVELLKRLGLHQHSIELLRSLGLTQPGRELLEAHLFEVLLNEVVILHQKIDEGKGYTYKVNPKFEAKVNAHKKWTTQEKEAFFKDAKKLFDGFARELRQEFEKHKDALLVLANGLKDELSSSLRKLKKPKSNALSEQESYQQQVNGLIQTGHVLTALSRIIAFYAPVEARKFEVIAKEAVNVAILATMLAYGSYGASVGGAVGAAAGIIVSLVNIVMTLSKEEIQTDQIILSYLRSISNQIFVFRREFHFAMKGMNERLSAMTRLLLQQKKMTAQQFLALRKSVYRVESELVRLGKDAKTARLQDKLHQWKGILLHCRMKPDGDCASKLAHFSNTVSTHITLSGTSSPSNLKPIHIVEALPFSVTGLPYVKQLNLLASFARQKRVQVPTDRLVNLRLWAEGLERYQRTRQRKALYDRMFRAS